MNTKKFVMGILIILCGAALSFLVAFTSELSGFFLGATGRLLIVTGMLVLFASESKK